MVATSVTGRADLVLLDTGILIIYAREGHPAEILEQRLQLQSGQVDALISVVTIGEALAFARKNNWGERRQKLLRELIRTRLVPIDINRPEIFEAYAELDHFSAKEVKPARVVGKNDLWIAATTMVTGATLITTDADFDHFEGVKVKRLRIDPKTLMSG